MEPGSIRHIKLLRVLLQTEARVNAHEPSWQHLRMVKLLLPCQLCFVLFPAWCCYFLSFFFFFWALSEIICPFERVLSATIRHTWCDTGTNNVLEHLTVKRYRLWAVPAHWDSNHKNVVLCELPSNPLTFSTMRLQWDNWWLEMDVPRCVFPTMLTTPSLAW